MNSVHCRLRSWLTVICASLLVLPATVAAQIIDPEAQIKKKGHQTVRVGDDGVTRFYTFTERASPTRIAALERDIAALPKHVDVFKVCDQTRGSVKAKLIADRGVTFDVAATNYGYAGSTIACTLKYMHDNKVGTQLMYMKKGAGGMYMMFVTD